MMLGFAALVIVPFWFIFAKQGFPDAESAHDDSVVNLINLYIFGVFGLAEPPGKRQVIAECRLTGPGALDAHQLNSGSDN